MQEFFPSLKIRRALAKLTAARVISAVSSGEHCHLPTPDADGTRTDIYRESNSKHCGNSGGGTKKQNNAARQNGKKRCSRYVSTVALDTKSKIRYWWT